MFDFEKEKMFMAAMTTNLTEFSEKENYRLYTLDNHTVNKPQLVHQSRKVPVGNQVVQEDVINVQMATNSAEGVLMPQRCSMTVKIARPLGHESAVMASLLTVFRDIIAGDEFANTVDTSEYLV